MSRSSQHHLLALVLAGGEGRRLMPLTAERAKPAVPFGGHYRLIDFVLSNFVNSGYFQIKVLTQYKASSLISHINRGWPLAPVLGHYVEPVPAQMRVSRDWFKGSADAVFQNLNLITDARPELVAVFGADHIYKMDVRQMEDFHTEKGAHLTVASIPVPIEQGSAFGILQVDEEGRIIDFVEKPTNPPPIPGRPDYCLASMGNYIFDSEVLVEEVIKDATRAGSAHDFGKNIITRIVPKGRAFAYDFALNEHAGMEEKERGYWRDVGTLESYWEASMDLVAVSPIFSLYNRHWPIRTSHLHLPPAKFVFSKPEHDRAGVATESLVSPGCIVSGAHVHQSILSPAVFVHSYAYIERSVIGEGCDIGRHAVIQNALLDKFVTVDPHATIGVDPEHDRARGLHISASGLVAVPKGTHVRA